VVDPTQTPDLTRGSGLPAALPVLI
jgi:hypothetical protein